MSGWINWGAGLLFLAAATMAGCIEIPLAGGGAAGRSSAPVKVLGGAMVAMPPAGYCVDTKASHAERDSAVILMGRCSGASQTEPALITLTIGAEGSSSVLKTGAKALSDFFRSPAGRAVLARDGKASSVNVSRVSISDGALVMRVEDRKVGAYWRAVLGMRSRLVTLSVSAPEGRSLSDAAGRRILDEGMSAMRRANPPSAAAAAPRAAATAGE